MKILTIIGARPQFVKAAIVSKTLAEKDNIHEVMVHTGQHFDANMSDIFFNQLEINKPDYTLNINGGTHGDMTGRMLIELETIILKEKPDCVMVYGDTNSTLAGALAASKLHIPIVHVEAGLRSFNMDMPEEINRILTDQISSVLFCPTDTAIENLQNEGFNRSVRRIDIIKNGDVMLDIALLLKDKAIRPNTLPIDIDNFIVVTCHRQENTDNPENLRNIIEALNEVHQTISPVVLPLHPRTAKQMKTYGLTAEFVTIDPVGYLEMLWLLSNCGLVITDSGGVQKEAFFMEKYCLTMREQTEWTELVTNEVNTLVGTNPDKICKFSKKYYGQAIPEGLSLYGDGRSAKIIADYLTSKFN